MFYIERRNNVKKIFRMFSFDNSVRETKFYEQEKESWKNDSGQRG